MKNINWRSTVDLTRWYEQLEEVDDVYFAVEITDMHELLTSYIYLINEATKAGIIYA